MNPKRLNMKKLLIPLFALLIAGATNAQDTTTDSKTINLNDKEQVTTVIETFVTALKEGDFETEKAYRAETFYWWNKVKQGFGAILPNDVSLAEVGDMDNLQFADELDIDLDKRMVSRIFCTKTEDGVLVKNRYLFIVNEIGKIEGILFIPPLTKSKYAELPEEVLEAKIIEFAEGREVAEEEDPMINMRCGFVAPKIESLYGEFDMWGSLHTIPYKNPEKHLPKDDDQGE
jgi:hypothetical protein